MSDEDTGSTARLFALAISARRPTYLALALTRLGSEALEHAEDKEKRLPIRKQVITEKHKSN